MTSRILIVDDSQTIRKLVEISLRPTGWRYEFAASGTDGIGHVRRNVPDVILLDFVLPDMRGTDVCAQLTDLGFHGSVILMTAKGENVRELFRSYPFVADYIAKPFTPELLVERTQNALQRVRRPTSRGGLQARPPARVFTHAQREAVAKVLYARLRGAFAHIPAWHQQMGPSSVPAQYFGRKILTPEVMDELLDALADAFKDQISNRGDRASEALPDAAFRGRMDTWPIGDLVNVFGASGRTGLLYLSFGDDASSSRLLYWRKGELVLVTTKDATDYTHRAALNLDTVDRAALARAEAEQGASGKPVHVTLAEAGELPPADLTQLLHSQSKRLLIEALSRKSAHFAWKDLAALPLYVEAHGRFVSTSADATSGTSTGARAAAPPSIEQVTIERLRRDQLAAALGSQATYERYGDTVFGRLPGFSDKVKRVNLLPQERSVLAMIDGYCTFDHLVARAGLDERELSQIITRLSAIGFIAPRTNGNTATKPDNGRVVMILEPDIEGFQRPLESILRSRGGPITLRDLGTEGDVVSAVRRERPQIVILNAQAAGDQIGSTARAIRASQELGPVSLVAILESQMSGRAAELSAAGFDVVLIKPVAVHDLERIIDDKRLLGMGAT